MSGQLADNVVVVTGGAGRLGRAFCGAIAGEGGTAAVADTDRAAAESLVTELCAKYGPTAACVLSLDITNAGDIDHSIDLLSRRFGRIDAVVNNAYPRNERYGAKIEDVTYADFAENLSLHVAGYFITAQRFAAYFTKMGRGNIVFIGSIYGIAAPRFDIYSGTEMTMPVEYSAIKAGVIHLARYLAQYYKSTGIRVNALSPGGVYAGQPESFVRKYGAYAGTGKLLDATDLTGALIFLLSTSSARITGQNLVVDDGWTL